MSDKLIGWRVICNGNMQSTIVDIKLLVSVVLHSMACGVIIAHNHPSGNLLPSKTDEALTEKIKYALKLIDVKC